MFDAEYFIYSDDTDLSWRVWVAGYKVAGIYEARLHHRGAAGVNPSGGIETVEFRTTDKKRFLTNRNGILTLLKDCQHILHPEHHPAANASIRQIARGRVVYCDGCRFARASFRSVLADCWRLRSHVMQERKRVASFRKRSDFWMLPLFRLRPNRWFEVTRLFKFGMPRVDAK